MQNIIAVNFKVESEGYQAITTLRQEPLTEQTAILEMALVKRNEGKLTVCDSFNSGAHTTDDTARDGLLGGLLGIIGGPVGVLLGGSAGALTGSVIDAGEAADGASMIETVASKMFDGDNCLIILAEESEEAALDKRLSAFDTEILRFDAAVIAEEVEEARLMEKEMARQARMQLRAAKKEERKQKIEAKRAEIEAGFEKMRAKFPEY